MIIHCFSTGTQSAFWGGPCFLVGDHCTQCKMFSSLGLYQIKFSKVGGGGCWTFSLNKSIPPLQKKNAQSAPVPPVIVTPKIICIFFPLRIEDGITSIEKHPTFSFSLESILGISDKGILTYLIMSFFLPPNQQWLLSSMLNKNIFKF